MNIEDYNLNINEDENFIHLTINKNDGSEIQGWDTLQGIKNYVFGEEVRAIEVYPKQSELVNYANCRHLWVFKADIKLPSTF